MNKQIKVLVVIGTRPEAVKMAPLVQELRSRPEVNCVVCATAQHRQMLDQVLNLFKIDPDIDLDLMQPNQSLAKVTSRIFDTLDPVITRERPDWILAQGDTTTVMVASVLAYYHRVKFGHVEAGLRTGDNYSPFPEEVNRRIASVIGYAHFAPTSASKDNLLRENIPAHQILVTGNTVIDALHQVAELPCPPEISDLIAAAKGKRIILVTAHRRENFGEPLEAIFTALSQLADHYKNSVQIVYPVHLNPNVQEPAQRILSGHPNITLLPPLDYLPMVHLMKQSTLILTDSGGLQEEAPGFGKPVLVLRDVTERPEGIAAGTVRLAGTNSAKIIELASKLLDDPTEYDRMARSANPYGDGHASKRIADHIIQDSLKNA